MLMITRFLIIIFLVLSSSACTKKEDLNYKKSKIVDPIKVYKEALNAFEKKRLFLC